MKSHVHIQLGIFEYIHIHQCRDQVKAGSTWMHMEPVDSMNAAKTRMRLTAICTLAASRLPLHPSNVRLPDLSRSGPGSTWTDLEPSNPTSVSENPDTASVKARH